MPKENVITFVNPASDPRLSPVALPADQPAHDHLEPPASILSSPEDSVGRLHLAEMPTDEEWQRLEAVEAIGRLMDLHGVEAVSRWVKLQAMNRGVILPDHRG